MLKIPRISSLESDLACHYKLYKGKRLCNSKVCFTFFALIGSQNEIQTDNFHSMFLSCFNTVIIKKQTNKILRAFTALPPNSLPF